MFSSNQIVTKIFLLDMSSILIIEVHATFEEHFTLATTFNNNKPAFSTMFQAFL